MGRTIQDEFTDLKVSRQRKKQLRWTKENRCNICGIPLKEKKDKFKKGSSSIRCDKCKIPYNQAQIRHNRKRRHDAI